MLIPILLHEDFFSDLEVLKESMGDHKGRMVLKGLFQKADAQNQNKRVYPRKILEREIQKFQLAINEKRSAGELDHPDDPKIHLDRVSHLITECMMESQNGDVHGKLTIAKTPCGQIAEGLVESGMKVGISSRGMGSLKEAQNLLVVQEDFGLVTFDLVAEPSTDGAWVAPTRLSEDIIKLINDPKSWNTYEGKEFRKEVKQVVENYLKERKK